MKHKFRKEGGKMRKRIFSIAMALAVVVTAFALPQNTSTVQAGGVNAPSPGTFWTSDQLSELSDTDLDTKAYYGNKAWYAIGVEDDGSLVMLSDSAIGESNIAFDDNFSTDYSNSDIKRNLDGNTAEYSVGRLFSAEEQAKITETTYGKLYLPDNNQLSATDFKVGSTNQYSIPIATWTGKNSSHEVQNFFWLRSAHVNNVFCVYPNSGDVNSYPPVAPEGSVVPTFNLNLSSVLFSSAAPAASYTGSEEVTVNGPMTFRFTDSDKIKSTATYNGSIATVTKSDDSDIYLRMQYNYDSKDWIKTWKISSSGDIDLRTAASDLSNTKIWLEKKDGNLLYAKEVKAEPNPEPEPDLNSRKVYRFSRPDGQDWLMTNNEEEIDNLLKADWIDEGLVGIAGTIETGVPVRRFYNENTGERMYSSNEKEIQNYIDASKYGWIDEGIAFYTGKNVEVIRFYTPFGTHIWSSSKEEQNILDSHFYDGWKKEGVAFYL